MQNVYITLSMSELIYDIQNKTYLTGKSRKEGDNHELVANMQANDDEENANQILRSISTAFESLKNRLAEYLDVSMAMGDNVLPDGSTDLTLTLKMPSNYNLSTVGTLTAAAHNYIVSAAVSDWFTITYKKDAPDYAQLAKGSLAVIEEAVNKRQRPKRQTPSIGSNA